MRSARDLDTDLNLDPNRSAADDAGRPPRAARGVKAKPRYSEVADQLRLSIITGEYPVGTLLPSESELCGQFGVSRHTVREAIRILALRGLVSRQQGRGTRVESDHHVSRVARLLGSIDEVERHGRDTHLVNIRSRMIRADADLAALLPCEQGEALLFIESYREARDSSKPWPTAWNETYIREPYAGIQSEIESWPGAVYSLLERRYGERVVSIRQEVAAVNLGPALARRLEVKAGTAGLRVKRAYIGRGGEALLFGFNTYVGDQFALVMDIKAHH